jgi:hypothetical protein
VFPARYELNSYIVFRKRLVSKRLNITLLLSVAMITLHESIIHTRNGSLNCNVAFAPTLMP